MFILDQASSAPPLTQERCIPLVKTKTFGHTSFSYAAPFMWDSLPFEICQPLHLIKNYSENPSEPTTASEYSPPPPPNTHIHTPTYNFYL